MSHGTKDARQGKSRKTKGKKEASTAVEWYVDIMGPDDVEYAPNVFIGEFGEAAARARQIASAITILVDAGLGSDELSVRLGVFRMTKGGDA